jgi:hypothetical protein
MEGYFRVYGSKGWLEVDQAFVYEGLRLRGNFSGTRSTSSTPPAIPPNSRQKPITSPLHPQNNLEPQSPGEEGLRDMRYITRIYKLRRHRNLDFQRHSPCPIHSVASSQNGWERTNFPSRLPIPYSLFLNPCHTGQTTPV